jgi:hypothetical protein
MMRECRQNTMSTSTISKNSVPIRLPDERWSHIEYEHDDLAGLKNEVLRTVSDPDRILAGGEGELLAVRQIGQGKLLVVVYKELSASDGFVITAYLTRRTRQLERRMVLWP